MERKLIKQGGGGYTIYLPKKWIDEKGLKGGESIDVQEEDNLLIIRAGTNTKSELNLEINENNRTDLRIILTHGYRRGIDKINITNLDNNSSNELKKIVSSLLLGFEITKKDEKSAVIENISEPTDQKFDVIMKRLLLLTSETINFVNEECKKGKFSNINEMNDIRANHDRFLLFCRRLITKGSVQGNPVLLWEFLTFLQHIEHGLYYLYVYLNEKKPKLGDRTIKLMLELNKYFSLLSESFEEKDLEKVHRLHNEARKYNFDVILKQLESSKGKETVVLSYLREIFRLIQISTSPILSTIVDKKN
ncbi:MAG: AbrB/MazE/SpoVT family DNA-binding domain-containing protein [archaeon]